MDAAAKRTTFTLVPERDVSIENGRFVSLSDDPWLRIEGAPDIRSRFLEIVYRASLLDDPARPILRFVTDSGVVDRILPGPTAGAGVWRGAAPAKTRSIWISPTNRPGRFDFQIESIRPVGLFETLAAVRRRAPGKLWSFFVPTLFGYVAEAENALDWATNSEPLENFASWRARRERGFDRDGIDAPRICWRTGPVFAVVVQGDAGNAEAVSRTIRSLQSQIYERLKATIVSDDEDLRARLVAIDDARISFASARDDARILFEDADFIGLLRAGDELAPHALACFAEEAARTPEARLIYCDELLRSGGEERPLFKPNWSPVLEAFRPYLDRAAFLRTNALTEDAPTSVNENSLSLALRTARARLAPREAAHLRRCLLSRDLGDEPATPIVPAAPSATPSVSIILLTRDRPDLLGPCVESILSRSTHPAFELLIVDNGSRRATTKKILERAANDPRVCVLHRPGAFNFAALNNDAVRSASGDALVFLNNDTLVVSPDWLEHLTRHAADPTAGAIGGLLLYPDGRIQHAGIVVGLGEDAGHFGALVPPEAPSWLDRARHVHEISAVTAACMAVERKKFEAVGGFDAVNLPIEFNDVDLCLRLAERGWISRYAPAARLIHFESATRGNAMFRPLSVYAKERDYFRRRWTKVIRDDPYFHPSLSLYARRAALW